MMAPRNRQDVKTEDARAEYSDIEMSDRAYEPSSTEGLVVDGCETSSAGKQIRRSFVSTSRV